MALALGSPDLISDIVAVDNSPADVSLSREFPDYVRAMKKVQAAQTTRQAEADEILAEVEKVSTTKSVLLGSCILSC